MWYNRDHTIEHASEIFNNDSISHGISDKFFYSSQHWKMRHSPSYALSHTACTVSV